MTSMLVISLILVQTFYVAVAFASFSMIGAIFVPWFSVKKKPSLGMSSQPVVEAETSVDETSSSGAEKSV